MKKRILIKTFLLMLIVFWGMTKLLADSKKSNTKFIEVNEKKSTTFNSGKEEFLYPLSFNTEINEVNEIILSQNTDEIFTDSGADCPGGDSWWFRSYDLSSYELSDEVTVVGLEFAISEIDFDDTLYFYAYELTSFPGDFDVTNPPASIASTSILVSPENIGEKIRVTFDEPVVVSGNSNIVIAVVHPSFTGNRIIISTTESETVTNYVSSSNCGFPTPLPVAEVGFPDAAHFLNLVVEADSENPTSENDCSLIGESNNFEMGVSVLLRAEDVIVSAGETMTIENIEISVFTGGVGSGINVDSVSVIVYDDVNGLPGNIVTEFPDIIPTSQTIIGEAFDKQVWKVDIPVNIILEGDESEDKTYWIAFGLDGQDFIYTETSSAGYVGSPQARFTGEIWYLMNFEGVYVFHANCNLTQTNEDDCDQGDDSNWFEDGLDIAYAFGNRHADDFFVSEGNNLNINQIEINIIAYDPISHMNFNFYNDDNGKPGSTIVHSLTNVPVESYAIGSNWGRVVYTILADVNIDFQGGPNGSRYWMQPETFDDAYWEISSEGSLGYPMQFSQYNNPWEENVIGNVHGVFKLHCDPVSPPEPDCYFDIIYEVEPITRVVIANVDNLSSPSSTIPLEDFTDVEIEVSPGLSYEISLEGNTNGDYTNYFTLFVDLSNGEWTQFIVADMGFITNSNGTDGVKATKIVDVPEDLPIGEYPLRILKTYGGYGLNPCAPYNYGQAEDYTLKVVELGECTGVPSGGVVLVNPEEGNPGDPYIVSATEYSIGLGLTYQWQSNTNGEGWVNQGEATTSYESFNAIAPFEFEDEVEWRLEITCTNSAEVSYSSTATFLVSKVYCEPSIPIVSPITRVVFAGIDNYSAVDSEEPYEDFTHISGNVNKSQTYEIALEAKNLSITLSYFTVWIDWNQNGVFETNEMYEIGSIPESTGTDGQQAINNILIPEHALEGATRMRVIVNMDFSPQDPCGYYLWGQAEDYTITVGSLGTKEISTNDLVFWPNPVTDVLNISAKFDVKSASVLNLNSQKILRNINVINNRLDVTELEPGTYIVQAILENGSVETFKIIKK